MVSSSSEDQTVITKRSDAVFSRRMFLASVPFCYFCSLLSSNQESRAFPMITRSTMAFELSPLPYAFNALEPYLSSRTLEFHHGKHHAAYVANTNALIKSTLLENRSLEEIIKATAGDNSKIGLFNNAAQVWNHTFFWNCMKPGGGTAPTSELAIRISNTFGSLDKFKEEFKSAALTQFGSGWAWLVLENNVLKITKTANADLPLVHGQKALLNCDVWEHAYYLDYQNRRPDFVQAFLNHLINWDFVEKNLGT